MRGPARCQSSGGCHGEENRCNSTNIGSLVHVEEGATCLLLAPGSCYSDSSVRITRFIAAAAALGLACEQDDIGKDCPKLAAAAGNVGGTRIETQEIVEQNAAFPCEELLCVASDGRAGYCTRKCREEAGCPPGFACRQVQELGEFAQDKFCVWKRCDRPRDCGNKDDFRCCDPSVSGDAGSETAERISTLCGGRVEGLGTATGEDIKLCTFRE
jgi:hypothetical protein